MTTTFFQFGEDLKEYPIRVLNERAIRAGAGLLFLFAVISFMNAWLNGNFLPTQVFVTSFLIDFTIRLFINPKYAPSLVLGQWLVRKQQPEYTGAPQKRFAWTIGFILASTMFYLVVLNNVVGPINIIVCALCLTLLFFETSFGICIGCMVYNAFNKEKAQLCPGNACDITTQQKNNINAIQLIFLIVFLISVGFIFNTFSKSYQTPHVSPSSTTQSEDERCIVPEFAKKLGHEEKWKLHNNCK